MKRSLFRKVSYILILLLVAFFLLESVLSIYYYQTYGSFRFATGGLYKKIATSFVKKEGLSAYYKAQQMARPDSSIKMTQAIFKETQIAGRFQYHPWLLYTLAPFNGKYVNTDGIKRKSIPESNTSDTGAIQVFFLGGSTMFGFNVADAETIPSYFVQLLKERNILLPIKVSNYGIPAYYSYHELILLTHLLNEGKRPVLIIFLDGLNDFRGPAATLYKKSLWDYRLAQTFTMDIRRGNPKFEDSSNHIFLEVPKERVKSVSDTLYTNYIQTIEVIKTLASKYNAQSYFFIQPVPCFKYPNQAKDPICSQIKYEQYFQIYPALQKASSEKNNLFFLGDMLLNEKGLPFIDGFHYSPAMNKLIASEILNKLLPQLQIFSKKNKTTDHP